MTNIAQYIEDSFSPFRDTNKREFEINGYKVIITYDGWYNWSLPCIKYESEDFEQFHECLQDALEWTAQTVKDDMWLKLDDGEITQEQYNEFLEHGGNYVLGK